MDSRTTAEAIRLGREAMAGQANAWNRKPNIYVCEACRGHIVTRDTHPGVTPFMTICQATNGCRGMMKSSMYRVFDQSIAEGWHWTIPDPEELISPYTWDHVSRGGLILKRAAKPLPLAPSEAPPSELKRAIDGARDRAEQAKRADDLREKLAAAERELPSDVADLAARIRKQEAKRRG